MPKTLRQRLLLRTDVRFHRLVNKADRLLHRWMGHDDRWIREVTYEIRKELKRQLRREGKSGSANQL